MERIIKKQIVGQFLLSMLFILSATLSFGQQRTFMAGAAKTVITPYLGGGIVGNFGTPPEAKNIHDELHARSLVLDDGDSKLAFIICDNIGLARKVCDAAKKEINARTGIPDRKSTRLNSSHVKISYAVFCLKKKKDNNNE